MPVSHRRVFHTLDGVRGVAALSIVLRHCDGFFGPAAVPSSYLAVDLFFGLSGFVIAFAYQDRLAAGLSVGRFVCLRFVRLYPLYILGMALAAVAALASGQWAGSDLARGLGFAALMLPSPDPPGLPHPYLYPLNVPAWSLFFELAINIFYGLVAPALTIRYLAAIVGAAALGLVAAAFHYGDLNVGAAWDTALGGWPRVAFSFFLGVLLFHLVVKNGGRRLRQLVWPWLIVLAFVPLARLAPVGAARIVYDLVCVLVVLPLFVLGGALTEPGPGTAALFRRLGLVSYAVYVLHLPAYRLAHGALSRLCPALLQKSPLGCGVAFIALLFAGCWLVDRFYDAPVRRALIRWTAPGAARPVTPGTGPNELTVPRRIDRSRR